MDFAVIDIETTYDNRLLSVGVIISNDMDFEPKSMYYYILNEGVPAPYGDVVRHPRLKNYPEIKTQILSEEKFHKEIIEIMEGYQINRVLAYNAGFDRARLPSLQGKDWSDIISKSAYKQSNPTLTEDMDFFKTGKLRKGYGVEPIYRLLSGKHNYMETHNAILDCIDELKIVQLLGYKISEYTTMKIR